MSLSLNGDEDPRHRSGAVYVPVGDGVTKCFSGDVYTIKASAESTNGSLGLVEATVPPGSGPVAQSHTRTDEAVYLLSGELEILDGARTFVAGAGDFVFIPRGIRHRFTNTGQHASKLLFMFTLAGEEAVFRYGDDPQPGQSPTPWRPERFATPEILKFNEDHAVEILPETAGTGE